jgi:hypothetical protein
VNSELTSGLPHSVLAANSKSMCSGCGLSVITENSTLSLSVTVLVSPWRKTRPTWNSSRYSPGMASSSVSVLIGIRQVPGKPADLLKNMVNRS